MLAMDLSRSNEELNNLDDNESLLNVSDIKIENVFENEDSVPRELILPNGWFPNFSLSVSNQNIKTSILNLELFLTIEFFEKYHNKLKMYISFLSFLKLVK